jgi:hypothetical protein
MGYNPEVFLGPYDECGKIDIFGIWNSSVKEKAVAPLIAALMDQYDLPIFVNLG